MEKSQRYIVQKANQKKQPKEFKNVRWINGTVISVEKYIQEIYRAKELGDLSTEDIDKLEKVDGKLLLLYTMTVGHHEDKEYKIPTTVLYDKNADFNTFSVTEVAKDDELGGMTQLVNMVARLGFPFKKFDDGEDLNKLSIKIFVGDFVMAENVEKVKYCAIPLRCEIEKS